MAKNDNETVRERSKRLSTASDRPKRLRQTANKVSWPAKVLGRVVKVVFGIIAIPFRTTPGRFIAKILGYIFFANYFKNSWKELRQVSWPNRKDTMKLTFAVFAFGIVFSLIIALADFGLDKLFRKVLIK